jgi:uncharacterized protein YqgV (UPF0045/DUF77 family)
MSHKVTVSIKFMAGGVLEKDLHPIVDKAIEFIAGWGLKYDVGVSNTTVEGNLTDILNKIDNLCKEMEKHVERFGLFLDIDYRRKGIAIDDKIAKYR